MEYFRPATWSDAVALKSEFPEALPINGGTDVMVDVNFGRSRPSALLDLSHLEDLKEWRSADGRVEMGAGMTYTRVIEDLADALPALALASRTVGSPQIRNRGTIGGNLATASPAGDAHPPLLATGATVTLESMRGAREIEIGEFFTGVKRSVLEPDELIRSISVPDARGPQQFSKVGTRNAMVIAVAAFAIALDAGEQTVGTGIGSAAPTPIRAVEAEEHAQSELTARGLWESREELPSDLSDRFSSLVANAASPIDDVRGSADYRHHALRVMARRTFTWAWDEYRTDGTPC